MDFLLSIIELASNTFYYMRLAILYLIHAILTSMIAMSWESLKWSSLPLIVIGNLGIVALEGMMAFIQSSRLHFYEFFSKFYQGTGKVYAPLRFTGKNTKILLSA